MFSINNNSNAKKKKCKVKGGIILKENKKSKEAKLKVKEPKNNIKKDKSKITDNMAKKEKKPSKFIEIIKKKWLINGTKTLILVLLIVAIFLGLNIGMQKLNLAPIDFSQEKLYTLTDESKNKVKEIGKEVHIYIFVDIEKKQLI